MTTLRFDGQVAIVTGAGGQAPSLGRSHAKLLAERGAKVVVNDLGVGPDGRGTAQANAEQVVDEIRAAGGGAVTDQHSVAEEDGARAIVQTALDTWGRLDILVNNAGVAHIVHFDEISSADIRKVIDVHLMGTLWMCRAAWPVMRDAGYGRIVNTTSGAMFGQENLSIYGTAKAGIFGLSRGLAIEGAPDRHQGECTRTCGEHDCHASPPRDVRLHQHDGGALSCRPRVAGRGISRPRNM